MKQNILVAVVLLAVIATAAYSYVSRTADDGPVTIAVLHPSPVFTDGLRGFKDRLSELGLEEGKDVIYLFDGPSGGGEALKAAANKIIQSNPDLILAASTPAARMAFNLTKDKNIPIVFAPVNDPVGAGIVKSLREPGGSATGIRLPASGGKRLQWLHEINPGIKTVLVPMTQNSRSAKATLKQVRTAANELGLEIRPFEVAKVSEIDQLLANFPADVDAIFLPRDSLLMSRAANISQFAINNKIPTSAPGISQVSSGALFGYAADQYEIGQMVAGAAHKIISGQAPGGIPVETADTHLYINLSTAEALGIQLPNEILKQARQVIR